MLEEQRITVANRITTLEAENESISISLTYKGEEVAELHNILKAKETEMEDLSDKNSARIEELKAEIAELS